MRLFNAAAAHRGLVVTLLVASTTPSALAQQSVSEQYKQARSVFLGQDYAATLANEIVGNLVGRWGTMPIRESGFEAACSSQGADIALTGSGFTMTSGAAANPVVVTYTSRGGNVFDSKADPISVLKPYGLDQTPESPLALALLADTSGITTVHRPSPDIIVLQTNYGIPHVYGRCGQ
jgi:hypothetical protein